MSQSSCFPHLSSSINRGRNSAPGPGLALLCSHFKQQTECAKGAVDRPRPCRAVAPWGVQVWVQHQHPSNAPAGQTRGCLLKQQNPSLSAGTQGEQQAVPLFAEVCQKEKKKPKTQQNTSMCTNGKRNKRICGAHRLGTAEQMACFIQQGAAAIPGAEIQLVEA